MTILFFLKPLYRQPAVEETIPLAQELKKLKKKKKKQSVPVFDIEEQRLLEEITAQDVENLAILQMMMSGEL